MNAVVTDPFDRFLWRFSFSFRVHSLHFRRGKVCVFLCLLATDCNDLNERSDIYTVFSLSFFLGVLRHSNDDATSSKSPNPDAPQNFTRRHIRLGVGDGLS